VNPTVAVPPEIAHDGEENKFDGVEMIRQVVSVGKPVAVPETVVPTGPEVWVKVKVVAGPDVTAKVAVAESPAPAFVSAVTV